MIGMAAYLLRIRQDMQRRRLLMYIGEKRVERLASFIAGYRACLFANGARDEEYEQFTDWLRARQGPFGEAWPAQFLQDYFGDHERAIQKYLDLVAEFAVRRAAEGAPVLVPGEEAGPAATHAGRTGTLEVLMRIRQDGMGGWFSAQARAMSADCFETFVEGCHACVLVNGGGDEEYGRFFEWLRDVKKEMPGEGWPEKYLRDCYGSHEQAIHKYLGFAAEFANLPSPRS